MNILLDAIQEVSIDEPLVIRSDNLGGIGVYAISGELVGYLAGSQPEGCIDYFTIASSLFSNRVLCKVAIKCGRNVFLSTESKLLRIATMPKTLHRVEIEGYGMMVR